MSTLINYSNLCNLSNYIYIYIYIYIYVYIKARILLVVRTGITVLLALSVFMSIMSSMLPSSSESMPLMISYIFILMAISVLTVVDSIVIVGLHHMEEVWVYNAIKIQLYSSKLSMITHYGCISNFAPTWERIMCK